MSAEESLSNACLINRLRKFRYNFTCESVSNFLVNLFLIQFDMTIKFFFGAYCSQLKVGTGSYGWFYFDAVDLSRRCKSPKRLSNKKPPGGQSAFVKGKLFSHRKIVSCLLSPPKSTVHRVDENKKCIKQLCVTMAQVYSSKYRYTLSESLGFFFRVSTLKCPNKRIFSYKVSVSHCYAIAQQYNENNKISQGEKINVFNERNYISR